MANCPSCQHGFEADFGMVACPSCGHMMIVDVDGNIQKEPDFGTVSAVIDPSLSAPSGSAPTEAAPVAPQDDFSEPISPEGIPQASVPDNFDQDFAAVPEATDYGAVDQVPQSGEETNYGTNASDDQVEFGGIQPDQGFSENHQNTQSFSAEKSGTETFQTPEGTGLADQAFQSFEEAGQTGSFKESNTESESISPIPPAPEAPLEDFQDDWQSGGESSNDFNESASASDQGAGESPGQNSNYDQDFGDVVPSRPAEDLSEIADYGNSEVSLAKDGGFLYHLRVSGIDSAEVKKELFHCLQDRRFAWGYLGFGRVGEWWCSRFEKYQCR